MADSKDGRAVARENEVRVLRALNRFGWLRTRDLAALVWQEWARSPAGKPSLKPATATAAGLRMAQRTLRRLREKRLVLSSRAPDGSVLYALAEAGARALQQMGISATTGKDLMRTFSAAHYRHRCIANEIAVGAIVAGCRVSTEREIAQGLWFGGAQGIVGKKPDVLIRSGDTLWWVEVERSRKNAKDYAALLKWLRTAVQDAARPNGAVLLGEKMRWGKVMFVCTSAFEARLRRDLLTAGVKKHSLDAFISCSTELYQFEDIAFS